MVSFWWGLRIEAGRRSAWPKVAADRVCGTTTSESIQQHGAKSVPGKREVMLILLDGIPWLRQTLVVHVRNATRNDGIARPRAAGGVQDQKTVWGCLRSDGLGSLNVLWGKQDMWG